MRRRISRAVALCTRTLTFTGEGAPSPVRSRFALALLVEELAGLVERRARTVSRSPMTDPGDNLFRPFAGSARPGGTGLSLAIAREVMRAHGGEIARAQTTAAGTAFVLKLPAPSGNANVIELGARRLDG